MSGKLWAEEGFVNEGFTVLERNSLLALDLAFFKAYNPLSLIGAGWSSPVARQAHNLKVVGSNPTPATNFSFILQLFTVVLKLVYSSAVFKSPHSVHNRGLRNSIPMQVTSFL